MNDRPFFSIVVPVYNRSNILIQTISYILKQRFKDFEIIIVDDGSVDNSIEIIKTFLELDQRIKLVTQENKERGAARNAGFLNSNGEYVIFFDSDDIMHENHLNVLSENIRQQNFPLFIATKFDFIDEEGNHLQSDIIKLKQGYYDYKLFLDGNPLACNICIKKQNAELYLFEEDRQYSIKEDWLFMIQNLYKNKLYIVDQITISMTDHAGRSMRSDNNIIIKRTLSAYEWILEKIKLTPSEQNQLFAHVNYFCGIHSYLDNNRNEGFRFIKNAFKYGGIKMKYLSLFLKTVLGRNIIKRLK